MHFCIWLPHLPQFLICWGCASTHMLTPSSKKSTRSTNQRHWQWTWVTWPLPGRISTCPLTRACRDGDKQQWAHPLRQRGGGRPSFRHHPAPIKGPNDKSIRPARDFGWLYGIVVERHPRCTPCANYWRRGLWHAMRLFDVGVPQAQIGGP